MRILCTGNNGKAGHELQHLQNRLLITLDLLTPDWTTPLSRCMREILSPHSD